MEQDRMIILLTQLNFCPYYTHVIKLDVFETHNKFKILTIPSPTMPVRGQRYCRQTLRSLGIAVVKGEILISKCDHSKLVRDEIFPPSLIKGLAIFLN
jgi:hypothetical protein